jgi:tetratricopeptide (TPR) repeat protein
MHINHGSSDRNAVLSNETFSNFVSPHFDTPWGDKIGLSWFLQSYLDRPIIMHSGNDTGFESIMYIYPEDSISIIVMANRDFSRTGRIINAASEILFGKEPAPYTVSAKYPFSDVYYRDGTEQAIKRWQQLKKDTTDIYYVNNEDLLTSGAVLENGKKWKEAKEILEYYLSLDQESTYAWRLMGNVQLGLGDTTAAVKCYEQTLIINPDYQRGKEALEHLQVKR